MLTIQIVEKQNMEVINWLAEQQQNRERYLIIDTLATPNPLKQLFKVNLTNLNHFVCLYKDTEFAQLAEVSPWLIPIDNTLHQAMQALLDKPENNWGYLISIDKPYTLADLVQHWRDRIAIEEQPRSLYRFQDNRIIIRHLTQLKEQDISLLLGPISEVMAWDGQQTQWRVFKNPQPRLYPNPTDRPWLAISEPDQLAKEIRQKNMMGWLLSNYPNTIFTAEIYPLYEWVEEQLTQADKWQWQQREQQQLLIVQRLDKDQRTDNRWQPIAEEAPEKHFERCKNTFNKPLHYAELAIDVSKLD